jgi:hypothetical protein
VVVDDVEHDPRPRRWAASTSRRGRRGGCRRGGAKRATQCSPSSARPKVGHRHQLDRGDAEVAQVRQALHDSAGVLQERAHAPGRTRSSRRVPAQRVVPLEGGPTIRRVRDTFGWKRGWIVNGPAVHAAAVALAGSTGAPLRKGRRLFRRRRGRLAVRSSTRSEWRLTRGTARHPPEPGAEGGRQAGADHRGGNPPSRLNQGAMSTHRLRGNLALFRQGRNPL